jgi:hypothetical protein
VFDGAFSGTVLTAAGVRNFVSQLKPAVAIRGPQHRDVDADVIKPVDLVHPPALDGRLAFQFQAELGENAIAAARSSTTTPTWSIRWIVMSQG